MTRRLLAVLVLAAAALVVVATMAGAHVDREPDAAVAGSAQATTTTEALPGTTLEAEDRDDGTSAAPWLIGSGIVAAVAVGVGGLLLQRRAG